MSLSLKELLKQAAQLTKEEQLELISCIANGLKKNNSQSLENKHNIGEFRGVAKNLLNEIDATEYVNSLRGEWEEREKQLREG
ncbi:MAG: hypothetical protein HC903_09565 [Methylacidiphilales bacterium]|nr:hypothetical protein [Candidatus Methylacidiphilales bacterium]NJR14371.1 hypothetical protein [Calothrix sp. CSU_2_0]